MVPAGQLDKWVEPKKKEDSFEYSCDLGMIFLKFSAISGRSPLQKPIKY